MSKTKVDYVIILLSSFQHLLIVNCCIFRLLVFHILPYFPANIRLRKIIGCQCHFMLTYKSNPTISSIYWSVKKKKENKETQLQLFLRNEILSDIGDVIKAHLIWIWSWCRRFRSERVITVIIIQSPEHDTR